MGAHASKIHQTKRVTPLDLLPTQRRNEVGMQQKPLWRAPSNCFSLQSRKVAFFDVVETIVAPPPQLGRRYARYSPE